MRFRLSVIATLALVLGAGCESSLTVTEDGSGKAAQSPSTWSEVHYLLSEEDLRDGMIEFEGSQAFRSFSSQVTAEDAAVLEFQVQDEKGNWTEWQTVAADWKEDRFRNGHQVLPVTAKRIRLRTGGGVEFTRLELFDGEAEVADDDDHGHAEEMGEDTGSLEQGISRPGAWAPPGPVHAAGQAQFVRYEAADRCSGSLRPGTRQFGDFLRRFFPGARSYGGYNCRKIVGGSGLSVHSTGRALDVFVPLHNGQADNDLGDPIANFLIANAAQIGVTLVIWDRSIWQASINGNKLRPYRGQHPHHDHLHIELSSAAAAGQTPYFSRGLPAPGGACSVGGAILAKYNQMGGTRSLLGGCTTSELSTPDGRGRYNHFQNGSIYWTPQTGAQEIYGDIRKLWSSMGWERSLLGYPTTGERGTPDGRARFSHFEKGSIYWRNELGAVYLTGAIGAKWASLDYERSVLGYPTTSERATPDGVGSYNHFENGSIYWTQQTGAQLLTGGIRRLWSELDFERSPLGYPTSDELAASDGVGRYNTFQNGAIYWTPRTGPGALVGAIYEKWKSLGAEKSPLGYPLEGTEVAVEGGRQQRFENGRMTLNTATNEVTFVVDAVTVVAK